MRWILHADMDAFYASVEQRDHPEYRGKPVIIGGGSARGVVAAASYEARKYGVKSAMPGYEARRRCPHGIFLHGNMKKYAAVSRQIHEVFSDYTDQIEGLALDEAFLDISGSVQLFGHPLNIGRAIKRDILKCTGLNVSVGIAPNKLVAKIACSLDKPNGLFLVHDDEKEELLRPLPLRALWGIGPKAENRLAQAGLSTIGGLARASQATLTDVFGAHGQEMAARARGEDDRPVVPGRERKSIGEESTFSHDIFDRQELRAAIAGHAEEVAARARRAGVVGKTLTLKLKLATRRATKEPIAIHELYPIKSKQMAFDEPTAEGLKIRDLGWQLLDSLALDDGVRLCGLTLSNLHHEDQPRQLSLLEWRGAPPPDQRPLLNQFSHGRTKSEMVSRLLDQVQEKYGDTMIYRGHRAPEKTSTSDRKKWGTQEDED
ncbi:MAG: DNA polymerase IV [Polyangiaceae bacterium]|nr:DNA polymerase IV [Polyangiaceae bacterium]